jgi:hypothetical protein
MVNNSDRNDKERACQLEIYDFEPFRESVPDDKERMPGLIGLPVYS